MPVAADALRPCWAALRGCRECVVRRRLALRPASRTKRRRRYHQRRVRPRPPRDPLGRGRPDDAVSVHRTATPRPRTRRTPAGDRPGQGGSGGGRSTPRSTTPRGLPERQGDRRPHDLHGAHGRSRSPRRCRIGWSSAATTPIGSSPTWGQSPGDPPAARGAQGLVPALQPKADPLVMSLSDDPSKIRRLRENEFSVISRQVFFPARSIGSPPRNAEPDRRPLP